MVVDGGNEVVGEGFGLAKGAEKGLQLMVESPIRPSDWSLVRVSRAALPRTERARGSACGEVIY